MPALATELLLIVALVLVNGLLAMSELAIVSVRKARLHQRAERGDASAAAALALANDPSRFLSTVQIGITLVGILTGAVGGATLTRELESLLGGVSFLAPYRETLSFGLVVLGITYLTLILGELVPKRVALNHAERLATTVASPMRVLATATGPLVWVLSRSTDAVLHLLRERPSEEDPVRDEEIKILIQQATEAGVFEVVEQELVEAVLSLDDRRVSDLMTPRPLIEWLDANAPSQDNYRKMAASRHAYFPVADGALDDVLGVASVKRVWAGTVAGEQAELRSILFPPVFIAEQSSALRLLEVFQQPNLEMALVSDEHGGIVGLVTMTDLLDAMTGDVLVLGTRRELRTVRRGDGSWLLNGLLSMDEAKKVLHVDAFPDEERGRHRSLGGFVFTSLGHLPALGDFFDWGDWRFEVVDMDGQRINKVLVTPREQLGDRDQREVSLPKTDPELGALAKLIGKRLPPK